jgi:hypothetical protein
VLIVEDLMKRGVPAAFDKMGSYHQRGIGVNGDSSRGVWILATRSRHGKLSGTSIPWRKTSGTYDNPGQGFWGNRTVALKMLECSYAQGNGNWSLRVGRDHHGDDKTLGEDHGRALKALHDAVKFGSSESAGYLSSAFRSLDPLTGNKIDTERANRYRKLRGALDITGTCACRTWTRCCPCLLPNCPRGMASPKP